MTRPNNHSTDRDAISELTTGRLSVYLRCLAYLDSQGQKTVSSHEMAERFPFEANGRPGLDVSGDGRGCNTLTGRFRITEATIGPTVSFTAAFEQHCEGGTAALRGCVHYQAP